MANTSRINGFRPVCHTNGSPYNGGAVLMYHNASDAHPICVGDVVVYAGNAQNGYPTVNLAAQATAAGVVGVVIGIVPKNTDPVTGALNTGSLTLDTPQYIAASTGGYCLVETDTTVLFEVEGVNGSGSYTYASGDVSLNADAYCADGSTTTGTSAFALDIGGTKAATASLQFRIWGVLQRPDNEQISGTSTAVKFLAKINNSTLGNGQGSLGIA